MGQTQIDYETGELLWVEASEKNIFIDLDNFGLEEEPGIIHPEYHPSDLVQKLVIPDQYDARKLDLVTPVKNQSPYDLCWAESVMAAAESNLILKGYAEPDIDLSEVLPHYFQWHRSVDPLGLTAGDQNLWHAYESYPGHMREWINSWSSGYRAVLLLSGWVGVAPESVAPYPDADADITDYSLPASQAWDSSVAYLKDAYWISMNDTQAIKRMIMKNGSVVIAFNQNRTKYLNPETGAYYCPDALYTNHLVNVIGWDDQYHESNFLENPGVGGAWLVKNSFGTNWGNDGFFWLSYADKTLSEDAFVFDFEPVQKGYKNYQYDGTISYNYLNDPNSRTFAAANIFKAVDNETLTAVSFTTPSSYFSYDIKIYRGVKDTPESGILFASQKGEALYAGYHTIDLETPVDLVSGDRFSVVIEITADKEGNAYLLTDRSTSYTVKLDSGEDFVFQELISTSNPGESFYRSTKGKWVDCWNEDPEKSLGNVRIKAFTELNSYAANRETEKLDSTFWFYRMDQSEPKVPGFANQ